MKTTLPKHTKKYIVQDNNGIGVKLVYLVGYCPDTLAYYNAFFKDAQKHFENLDSTTAICGKVRKSVCCQDFTLMIIPIENKKYDEVPGFETTQWEHLRIQSY